jgi:hypothetical protein
MATEFNSFDDGGPIPPVDSADLRTLWAMMEENEKKLKKLIPDYKPGHVCYTMSDDFYRYFSPGANVGAVVYRCSTLEVLQRMSKVGGPALPGVKDGQPTDALFKAFAVVPMNGLGDEPRVGFPCDWEELIRLVKIESEA